MSNLSAHTKWRKENPQLSILTIHKMLLQYASQKKKYIPRAPEAMSGAYFPTIDSHLALI